ncbi:MAG: hypothetical protein JNK87_23280, partial [Bryobacterales bacterium]|nr:hypothetical protein [Bryobacterales bacterium]
MPELQAVFSASMSGDEILEQLRHLGNAVPEPLWARLALLVTFDQVIYQETIREFPTAPSFSSLTTSGMVRSFDVERGEFALTAAKRADALAEQAASAREDLAGFAQRIVASLDPAVPSNRWNILAASLVAQPQQAAALFTDLYNAADESFDLAECSRLIDVLSARVVLLNDNLNSLWKNAEAYYRSRSLFVTDYYRSATYLKRSARTNAEGESTPPVEAQFESFWSSPQTWLLNVYGKGGSGKTMFVRWLIARRCLPRRNNQPPIAVARVDFDDVDLDSFDRFPELLLGPIMTQLSTQLPGRPFQTEASKFQQYAAYLKRGTRPSEQSDNTIRLNMNAAVSGLQSELGNHAVLVVLDTCEEPLIHRKAAFERMLAIFAQVHSTCPGVRLLVSGRYRLNEKGLTSHQSITAAVEVPPFSIPESRRYLVQNRGMKQGALVNAIAARGGGNPFVLSLFAELVAESPKEWTAKAVREAPSADLIYLLERVILRIPHPAVRWLVRYAAIPRLLTRDFAEKVIGPWLPLHHGSDDANRFRDPRAVRR